MVELLSEIQARGEKAVIFCKWKKLQTWIAAEIAERFGRRPAIINGDISDSTRRMRLVDNFSESEGFNAIVLSARAAGVGLNITAANHVIHFTREWNPAVENQATDRCYRIGQNRPVHVYYFIGTQAGSTTVQQTLDALLTEKRRLMNDFVVPVGGFEARVSDFK